MPPKRFRLISILAVTLAVYSLAIGVLLRWHWLLGPPHTQSSPWLMFSFGLCGAILGLFSILVAVAAFHWTRRASGFMVAVAVPGFFLGAFYDWDRFLIWQLLVMFSAQTVCLVVALITAQLVGCRLAFVDDGLPPEPKPASRKTLRFSISDIMLFTAATALLFVTVRRLATSRTRDDRLRHQHRRRLCHRARRVDSPLGMLRLLACVSQNHGAGPHRAHRRDRRRPGLALRVAFVQLAVVLGRHVRASPVHDDPLLDATGSGFSILAR